MNDQLIENPQKKIEGARKYLIGLVSVLIVIPSIINALSDIYLTWTNSPISEQEKTNASLYKRHFSDVPIHSKVLTIKQKGGTFNAKLNIYKNGDIFVEYGSSAQWFPIEPIITSFKFDFHLIKSAYAEDEIIDLSPEKEFVQTWAREGDLVIRRRIYADGKSEKTFIQANSGKVIKRERGIVAESLNDILSKHNIDDLYVSPNIPKKKLKNARKSAKVPEDNKIFALIDATVFGSAKNSMVFGNKGIYLHNDWASKNSGSHFLPYEQVVKAKSDEDDKYEVLVGNNVYFDVVGSDASSKEVRRLLEDIRIYLRAKKAN